MCTFENLPIVLLLFGYLGKLEIYLEPVQDIERVFLLKSFVKTFFTTINVNLENSEKDI
jgi:hypothetical protein